ncbi:GyrI-like domain-containing protein [Roseateles sp. NT4]|uniref:GyrI-like domain-containing protein n=1 Tax=Roseateles sp. NT4 TaxID=3453715 RepID=UPI003EEDC7AB
MKIIERSALTVVGLQIHATPMSPAIPALWPRFVARIPEIESVAEPRVSYGVMHNQAADQSFDYLAAVSVAPSAVAPNGMTRLTLPAGRYACFSVPLSGLGEGYCDIFERQLPASGHVQVGGPLFERYGEDFCPDDPASLVEIWVPVAPR